MIQLIRIGDVMEKLKNLSNIQKITLAILTTLILVIVILLTGKFAYSFLGADIDEDSTTRGEVTATGDALIFSTGNGLSLSATTDNFNGTSGNLSSSTNPSVKLVAASQNKNATTEYAAGFVIKENTYQYTTIERTPELILTIRDEADNIINSAAGLSFVTVGGVSGFDITELKGSFTVEENHSISTTSTTTGTTHVWTFTLTFVNLETDQSLNENSTLAIDAILQKDKIEQTETFASYIISTYGTDTKLYHHDASLTNGANDNSYRYAGASNSINNWVCFGSTASTCPSNNLYRIIGVFGNQIKLIKNTSVANGRWSGSAGNSSNIWENSTLNTGILNGTYLNGLGTTWSDKIATTNWKSGGLNYNDMNTPKDYYNGEVGVNSLSTTYSAKIGLMYVNDYGYAAYPTAWTSDLWMYGDVTANNWLYSGLGEWTISRDASSTYNTHFIHDDGYVTNPGVHYYDYDARPAFYLNANVERASGTGTQSDPYRIA